MRQKSNFLKQVVVTILFFAPAIMFSQIIIDEKFDDAELLNNPTWYGHIDSVEVYTSATSTYPTAILPSIRLKCEGDDESMYISTPNSRDFSNTDSEWRFWTKVPSATSNNNAKVYLIADRQDLHDPQLNGYYVSLGLQAKKLILYKQKGTVHTPIITGSVFLVNSTTNMFRVKVTRDASGNWNMYSDDYNMGADDYFYYPYHEGSGNDNDTTYDTGSWFGMVASYSSGSYSNNFYFDNLYSGPVVVDNISPQAIVNVSKPNIFVKFDEPVDTTDATNILNYCLLELPAQSSVACTPDSVLPASGNLMEYQIFYDNTLLLEDKVYHLVVKDIKDFSGNAMIADTFIFAFHDPATFDIVINEIMADPSPVVNLPNAEYVELYNRTEFPIDLTGWKFLYGSGPTSKTFPSVTIMPYDFIIITCNDNAMNNYGLCAPLFASSCTSSITNSGTTLTLTDPANNIIHTITYSDTWFNSSSKDDGGWSLEQIDPNNPCAGASNWRESEAADGGTPGKINSVYAPNPDLYAPQIAHIGVSALTPNRFFVYFDESLNYTAFDDLSKFKVMLNGNDLGNPSVISPDLPANQSATFYMPLAHPQMVEGNIYQLVITDTVADCVGNIVAFNSSEKFALPETVEVGDIIINELLSNPPAGGKDYVEVYNNSDKILNLGTMVLGTWDSTKNKIKNPKDISYENHLIFPGDYYCLTTDPDAIKELYDTPNPKGFIKMESMPSYNNDNGIVTIGDKSLKLFDKLTYYPEMHLPLLNSTKGVSLERISFSRPTEDLTNWHSASSEVGFGTPAYKNSQYAEFVHDENPFTIVPEIFSPDNDGYNDVLGITYEFNDPGYLANVIVYDSKGRFVRHIAKNALLGTKGVMSWDGITENQEKAGIGIYIIYCEITDLNGSTKRYKNTAVLGGRL